MISEAVSKGGRVGVLATNSATLEPTRVLLANQARLQGATIQVEERWIPGAFESFLAGDMEEHDRLVRQAVDEIAGRVERVVLAQASMARVLTTFPEISQVTEVLASPIMALASLREKLS